MGSRAVTELSIFCSQTPLDHRTIWPGFVPLYQMMGFPSWFKPIILAKLNASCRILGKFNRDQALKEPSEMCCAKFGKRQGFLKWMFLSNSG
jgi:hypothetical protein